MKGFIKNFIAILIVLFLSEHIIDWLYELVGFEYGLNTDRNGFNFKLSLIDFIITFVVMCPLFYLLEKLMNRKKKEED